MTLSTRNRSETQTVEIKPIRTKTDYRDALQQIESLMTAKANSPEGDRLDVLTTLVEAYERAHFPMDLPDAVEAIKFRMEQSGLTVKDLEPVIGRKNRVYEVLTRRRTLTLRMIEGLHTQFGIPAESLLRQGTKKPPSSSAKRS
jgi:HTH-type transcriptional regulator/antitoxin HigA